MIGVMASNLITALPNLISAITYNHYKFNIYEKKKKKKKKTQQITPDKSGHKVFL